MFALAHAQAAGLCGHDSNPPQGMKKAIPKGMALSMAPTGGFEPLACRLGGGRSILLSYVGIFKL